ncbi:MAG TPA: peptidase MA family metallohydrolase, partial [Candidatus Binatus sp.]|nr:peptidase MA family metallohydrolase [Candidatus Binatus sp.]
MGAVRQRGRRTIALAALVGAAAWAGLAAPSRAAEQPSFAPPTATATFLTGIDLREAVTLPSGTRRVDALVQTEGSPRTEVSPIKPFSAGPTSLSYTLQTPSGAVFPNTLVTLRFRVTLADGSQVLGPTAEVHYDDTRYVWKTVTGTVVRVHWTDGGSDFGQRALAIADKAVADAAALFGVSETAPIDFYIYADRTAFYDVIGPALQENIGGLAEPSIRTLFANIGAANLNDPWVAIVVPHELTHIVFGTATGNPYHEPLHWLNEGLAVYLSAGYDATARSDVQQAVANGTLMPLSSLALSFPGSADRFSLAYDEAVSAIDFMVRSDGRPAVVRLVRSYAQGLTDDEAFKAGIGVDVAGFEAAWLADLGAPAPSPFGPQPAPAG